MKRGVSVRSDDDDVASEALRFRQDLFYDQPLDEERVRRDAALPELLGDLLKLLMLATKLESAGVPDRLRTRFIADETGVWRGDVNERQLG